MSMLRFNAAMAPPPADGRQSATALATANRAVYIGSGRRVRDWLTANPTHHVWAGPAG